MRIANIEPEERFSICFFTLSSILEVRDMTRMHEDRKYSSLALVCLLVATTCCTAILLVLCARSILVLTAQLTKTCLQLAVYCRDNNLACIGTNKMLMGCF